MDHSFFTPTQKAAKAQSLHRIHAPHCASTGSRCGGRCGWREQSQRSHPNGRTPTFIAERAAVNLGHSRRTSRVRCLTAPCSKRERPNALFDIPAKYPGRRIGQASRSEPKRSSSGGAVRIACMIACSIRAFRMGGSVHCSTPKGGSAWPQGRCTTVLAALQLLVGSLRIRDSFGVLSVHLIPFERP